MAQTQDPRFAIKLREDGQVAVGNLNDVLHIAQLALDAGIAPNSMKTPAEVAIAIMTGAELGLGPMYSMQYIAVINRRPTIWGDAGLALVQKQGTLEYYETGYHGEDGDPDFTAWVKAKRRGQEGHYYGEFSWKDAERAGLVKNKDTYKKFPKDMLMWRARWRCLRQGWADALGGLIFREIVEDWPSKEKEAPREVPLDDYESVSSEPVKPQHEEPDDEAERLRQEFELVKANMEEETARAEDAGADDMPEDAKKPFEGEELQF